MCCLEVFYNFCPYELEVFLDGRQSPLARQTCKMFYLLLSQENNTYLERACEPDIKKWLTGGHCWVSERTGGISPPSAAPHF